MIRNLVLILILLVPVYASALQTQPHHDTNFIVCGSCHWIYVSGTAGTTPPWYSVTLPNPQDNTINNKRCYRCHDKDNAQSGAKKAQTHSKTSTDSPYWITEGGWSLQCTDCHEAHFQDQLNNYGSATYLASSSSATIVNSYNTFQNTTRLTINPGLTNDYYGYYILPDKNQFQIFYKILNWSSANNTQVDVRGKVDASAVGTGGYAVVYGKNIKSTVRYTNPAGNYLQQQVKFFRPEGDNSFVDRNNIGTSLCTTCHSKTRHMRNDYWASSAPDQWHASVNWTNGKSCMTSNCHDTHEKGFKPSCGSCHGYPPVNTATLVSSIGKTGSTTAGAHATHTDFGIVCDSCHHNSVGAGATHNAGGITLGFYLFNGASQGGAYNGQSGVSYNVTTTSPATSVSATGAKQCSNVYCHGATMAFKGGSNISPNWDSPTTGACGTCHAATASGPWGSVNTVPILGSHVKHAGPWGTGLGLSCSTCHPQVTDGTHVQGVVSWKLDASDARLGSRARYNGLITGGKGLAPSASYSACSNIYCHSSVQGDWGTASAATYTSPVWGSSGTAACGSCHATASTNPWLSSGSHSVHFGMAYTVCNTCHNGAGDGTALHANHNIDVIVSPSYGGSYSQMGATANPPGNGYGNCSGVSCHGSGTYQWGVGSGCGPCHKKNNTLAGKHSIHYDSATDSTSRTPANSSTTTNYIFGCGVCHNVNPTGQHNTGRVSTFQMANVIFDGTIAGGGTYAAGGYMGVDSYDWTAGSCSSIYCHSNGNGGAPNTTSFNWASGTANCASCHNYTAASGNQMVSGMHTKHTASTSFVTCDRCHYDTTMDAVTITDKTMHVNGQKDVGGDATWAQSTKTCSNMNCHSSVQGDWASIDGRVFSAPTWTSAATGACGTCHGTASTWSTTPTLLTGSHSKHLTNALFWQTGVMASPCDRCHSGAGTGTVLHVDDNIDVVIDASIGGSYLNQGAGNNPPGTAYGSCSGIACHASGVWGSSGSVGGGCTMCHKANNTLAGKHSIHYDWATAPTDRGYANNSTVNKYVFDCGICHVNPTPPHKTLSQAVVTFYTTFTDAGTYTPGGTAFSDSYDYTNGTCSAVYCHSDANGNTRTVANWATTTQALGCTGCHNYDAASGTWMTSGMHTKHVKGYSYDCSNCHSVTALWGSVIDKTKHVNKSKDVAYTNWNSLGQWDGGLKSCSTTYCHSNGAGTAVTPTWTSAATGGCGKCHGADNVSTPSSSAHTKHVGTAAGYKFSCSQCHNGTVAATADSSVVPSIKSTTLHVDKAVEIEFGNEWNTGGAWATATKTCSTLYCHSAGTSVATGDVPAGSITWTGSVTCVSCHGSDPGNLGNGAPWYTNGLPKANTHSKHSTDCSKCHYATTTNGSTITSAANHTNGQYDLVQKPNITTFTYSYSPSGGSCSDISCHFSGGASWGGIIACGGCHGLPSATNKHTVHTDGGHASYGDDTNWSTVAIYRYNCGTCHPLDSVNHANSLTNIELWNTSAAGMKKYTTSASWYTPAGGSAKCGNVYCHGDGNGSWKSTGFTWGTGTASCTSCHNYTAASGSQMVSGMHTKHTAATSSFSCDKCHDATTTDGVTISDRSKHANGVRNIAYDALNAGGTWTSAARSCGNLYCHSSVQGDWASAAGAIHSAPTWGDASTGGCGTCHGKADTWSTVTLLTGSHSKHLTNPRLWTTSATMDSACDRCHSGLGSGTSLHVNNNIDVVLDASVGGTYSQWGTTGKNPAGNGYGSCSGISCHASVTWGTSNALGCTACHKANNALAGKHGLHYNSAAAPTSLTFANSSTVGAHVYDCGICHVNTTPPHKTLNTAVVTFYTTFTDAGTYSQGGTVYNDSYDYTNGTCSAVYCHGDGNGNTVTVSNWATTTQALGCTGCHNYDTASTKWMTSGMHTRHVNGYSYDCSYCHSATAVWGSIKDRTKHVNKSKDVAYTNWNSTGQWTAGTKSCSSTYCHSNGTGTMVSATWTSAATGGCGKCHGADNTTTPSSSAHAKHVGTAAGYQYSCSQCHNATVTATADSTVVPSIKSTTLHVDKAAQVEFGNSWNTGGAWSSATKTCSSTYCHSTGTSVATGAAPTGSLTWTTTANCIRCHGNEPGNLANGAPWYTSGSPKANTHRKHSADCSNCHYATTTNGTAITTPANHANKQYNLTQKPGITTFSYNFSTSGGSCSNISCHFNGTATWGGTVACGNCHTIPPVTNKHTVHTDGGHAAYGDDTNWSTVAIYRFNCGTCHPLSSANHANGTTNIELWNTAATGMKKYTTSASWYTPASGSAKCGNVYCHGDGNGSWKSSALTWGTGTASCTSCHNYTAASGSQMVSGMHTKHTAATSTFSCDKCHDATTTDGVTISDRSKHANGVRNIAYDNWNTLGTWTSSSRSCNNLYCHSSVQGDWASLGGVVYSTPTWSDASTGACGTCHGKAGDTWNTVSTLDTGSHANHLANQLFWQSSGSMTSPCDRCHSGAGTGTALHVNRNIDVVLNASIGGSYLNQGAGNNPPGTTYGSCASVSCHGADTPVWGSPGSTSGCTLCHKANNSLAGKHAVHFDWVTSVNARYYINSSTATNYKFECGICHADTSQHKNLTKAVVSFYTAYTNSGSYTTGGSSFMDNFTWTNGTCSAVYCHSDGNGNTRTVADWATTTQALGCTGCHNYNANSGVWMTSGSHTKHVKNYSYECAKCHTATVNAWGTIVDKSKHVNRAEDIAFDGWNSLASWTSSGKSCSATYCHSDGVSVALPWTTSYPSSVATWSTSTTCNSCHGKEAGNNGTGKPHYANGSPKANTHDKHSDNCSLCHSATVWTTFDVTSQWYSSSISSTSNHANKVYNVGQKAGYTTFAYWYTTPSAGRISGCSNISCHFNNSATYGASLVCTDCHVSLSGAHNSHVGSSAGWYTYGDTANNSTTTEHKFSCGNCHPISSSMHGNGALDMELYNAAAAGLKANNPATAWTTFSGNNRRCGNIYCHSNGADPMNMAYAVTPAWGTVMGENKCGQCHDNPPQFSPVTVSGRATSGSSNGLGDASSGWGTLNWAGATIRITDGTGAGSTNLIVSNSATWLTLNAAWTTMPDSTSDYKIFMGQSHYVAGSLMGGEGGHLVGIHADNIYNNRSGLAQPGKWGTNSHGNSAYSTTITCYICHSGEVSWTTIDTYSLSNRGSSGFKCTNTNCHSAGSETPLRNGVITNKSLHVNGARDVSIANGLIIKSKAQIRSGSVPVMWNRVGIYKEYGSYDYTTIMSSNWNPATKTCTTACHNNNSTTWGESDVSCITCHNQTR